MSKTKPKITKSTSVKKTKEVSKTKPQAKTTKTLTEKIAKNPKSTSSKASAKTSSKASAKNTSKAIVKPLAKSTAKKTSKSKLITSKSAISKVSATSKDIDKSEKLLNKSLQIDKDNKTSEIKTASKKSLKLDSIELKPIEISKILLTIPEPTSENSPYADIIKKRPNVGIDFKPIMTVSPLEVQEVKAYRGKLPKFTIVIFNSRNAIDYFFRVIEEMRYSMSSETKYICASEQIALYLSKYITYRKRKVQYAQSGGMDLKQLLIKYKEEESFILPCSQNGGGELGDFLKSNMFTYYEFVAYNVSFNQFLLKTKIKYDIITFFNVDSVRNFQKMFPKYQQGKTIFIGFDENVYNALKSLNFKVHAVVSINENKSMVMMIKKILAI